MADAPTYTGPELTNAEKLDASRDALTITAHRTAIQVRAICVVLCIENAKLLKEVNEHRAARGLAPMPGYRVP